MPLINSRIGIVGVTNFYFTVHYNELQRLAVCLVPLSSYFIRLLVFLFQIVTFLLAGAAALNMTACYGLVYRYTFFY